VVWPHRDLCMKLIQNFCMDRMYCSYPWLTATIHSHVLWESSRHVTLLHIS
jgi:hypothetical protein